MKIMITSRTQGFRQLWEKQHMKFKIKKMVRRITLATRSSANIHGAIWLFSSRKYGFYFEYLYASIRPYILRKMLKKTWKIYGFFTEIIYSYFLSLTIDHSWSLQSQWRGTKPFTRQNKYKLHVLVISLVFAGLKHLFNCIFSFLTFKME